MTWGPNKANTNHTRLRDRYLAPLSPYLSSSVKMYKCPADRFISPIQRELGWTERVRSVAMNPFLGQPALAKPGSRYVLYSKSSELFASLSSKAWVVADEHPDSVKTGYFLITMDLHSAQPVWTRIPASYHGGGCVIGLADGHTEYRKWLARDTKQPVMYERWNYTQRSRSADRRDFDWLLDRSTVRSDGRSVLDSQ